METCVIRISSFRGSPIFCPIVFLLLEGMSMSGVPEIQLPASPTAAIRNHWFTSGRPSHVSQLCKMARNSMSKLNRNVHCSDLTALQGRGQLDYPTLYAKSHSKGEAPSFHSSPYSPPGPKVHPDKTSSLGPDGQAQWRKTGSLHPWAQENPCRAFQEGRVL